MKFVCFILSCFMLSSCASALHPGPLTAYQKRKPAYGQPRREIKLGFFIADLVCGGVPLAVDFATAKIYRESPKGTARKK